ncbi:MAG: tandem-95 repeat protein, partial [Flavobacteriales bacterium]
SGTVADNDIDIDSGELLYALLTAPQHGSLTFNQQGAFTYQPDLNYFGQDHFTYAVCDDSAACDLGSAILTVVAVNDGPMAEDDDLTLFEDATGQVQLSTNDTDPDGDALIYAALETVSSLGSFNLNSTGEFIWTSFENAFGVDTLLISVNDGSGLFTSSLLIVEVIPVNDAPIAVADAITTQEEISIQGSVIDNDMDVDDGMLSVEFLDTPSLGVLTHNELGWFSYTPYPFANGTEAIAYRICDAQNACDTSMLSITILSVNNTPYVAGEYTHVMEDTFGEGQVSINDQDPDQDILTYDLLTNPYHGSIVFDSVGQYTYTPTPNFSGLDSVLYSACDPGGLCASAWIIFEVDFINDAPIVEDEAIQVFMNGSIA